ncbi:MAG: ubiquinol-cytochrome C reductase [Alphaproteobacteria bacterium RIFOXYD12_FULL_60_8]|nr:MAG: ubiquinol-cytochrome C reductase [Alphaproteobacteria bacterium RIFOXYD12_FULL_60_8]
MAAWLFKSEPNAWSWDQQVARGAAGEPWSGVRNFQACANMKAMRVGERGFFYHSVYEKRIVGVVEVIDGYRLDPTDPTGRFGLVTIKALKSLPHPVTLAQIKADPRLEHLPLVRQSRLSVCPIDQESWQILCGMGGLEG